MNKRVKAVILLFLLVAGLFVLFMLTSFLLAYLDWKGSRERLMRNLREYHARIMEYDGKSPFVILDDEGRMVEIAPTRIYDRSDRVLGEFSPSKREIVQSRDIPVHLLKGLILIEDSGFYQHKGINVKGILRALVKNIMHLRIVEGGSSITQQLSKLLFTSRQVSIYRKFLEVFGTLAIEKEFGKRDILLMYLNTAYFGHGVYGLQAASQLYFNKNLRNLNQFEGALLISLLPSPNVISPFNNTGLAMRKHRIVLDKLKKHGLVSQMDYESRYRAFWSEYGKKLTGPHISYWKMNVNQAPYVVETVRQFLEKQYPVSRILQGSLKVRTTVDMDVQTILQEEVAAYHKGLKSVFTNEADYRNIQIAGIMMHPSTGEILGFVGGNGFTFLNQFNRAFYMKRQVGSSIKPFLYAAALNERSFTLTTVMTDRIMKFRDKNRDYIPKNYDNKNRGEIFFRDALIRSVNTVSVQILHRLTPDLFLRNYLDRIFFDLDDPPGILSVLSLALGTAEMSPYQLATAYSVLANGGNKVYPLLVSDVRDAADETLLDNLPGRRTVLSNWQNAGLARVYPEGVCYIVSDTLRNVFLREGTAYSEDKSGLKISVSGKTGTTSNNKDAWCAGYTRDYVLVLWMGFDDYQKETSRLLSGGGLVAPLVTRIFNRLYWNRTYEEFPVPSDELTFCNIDRETGKLAQSGSTNILYRVPYLNNTEPRDY